MLKTFIFMPKMTIFSVISIIISCIRAHFGWSTTKVNTSN